MQDVTPEAARRRRTDSSYTIIACSRSSRLPFGQRSVQFLSREWCGTDTATAFGDMQLFDLFVLPRLSRETGVYLAAGPLFVFPTATDKRAGQGAWQVGPAFGAIYKGLPGLIVGFLVQNPISFAYTSPDRVPVSTLLVQPIVAVYLGKGFYLKSADATWATSWYHHRDLHPGSASGSVTRSSRKVEPAHPSSPADGYRQFAPVTAQTTVRFE
jgi:hypothetical protein